jgi:hypothetical protein
MRNEALIRSLGRKLEGKLDTTEHALRTLKKIIGHDHRARQALRAIEELRASVREAAEELDPNLRDERVRRELSDTPRPRPTIRTPDTA